MLPRSTEQDLATRMIALANKGHPRAAELNQLATELNAASRVFFSPNPPPNAHKKLVGKWAKARRVWCEITGEPLV